MTRCFSNAGSPGTSPCGVRGDTKGGHHARRFASACLDPHLSLVTYRLPHSLDVSLDTVILSSSSGGARLAEPCYRKRVIDMDRSNPFLDEVAMSAPPEIEIGDEGEAEPLPWNWWVMSDFDESSRAALMTFALSRACLPVGARRKRSPRATHSPTNATSGTRGSPLFACSGVPMSSKRTTRSTRSCKLVRLNLKADSRPCGH